MCALTLIRAAYMSVSEVVSCMGAVLAVGVPLRLWSSSLQSSAVSSSPLRGRALRAPHGRVLMVRDLYAMGGVASDIFKICVNGRTLRPSYWHCWRFSISCPHRVLSSDSQGSHGGEGARDLASGLCYLLVVVGCWRANLLTGLRDFKTTGMKHVARFHV